jgi:hypothetical protein
MDDKEPLNVTEEMQRFTATGRPYKPPQTSKEGWTMNNLAGAESFGSAPANLLPVKFNDESLISVPVLRPEDVGKAEPQKTKKSFFSSRRKSSNTNFTIKQIPRGEYLKHYAKDDDGKYSGTELPADDCILRGEDVTKYRNPALTFKHEVIDTKGSKGDGVIR